VPSSPSDKCSPSTGQSALSGRSPTGTGGDATSPPTRRQPDTRWATTAPTSATRNGRTSDGTGLGGSPSPPDPPTAHPGRYATPSRPSPSGPLPASSPAAPGGEPTSP